MAPLRGWLGEAWRVLAATAVAMGVTLTNLFRRPITVCYPDERTELPEGARGLPVLLSDPDGLLRCIGCEACAKACPVGCIDIVWHRASPAEEANPPNNLKIKRVLDVYSIDASHCMYCGMCAEACPFEALAMSDYYELTETEPGAYVYDKERLAALGRRPNLREGGRKFDPYLTLNGFHRPSTAAGG